MSSDVSGQAADLDSYVLEAKTLVSELYDPANAGNPTKIKIIQEHLQILQRSPHAWLIANSLLGHESTDLRFFGALTFTVKINQDWNQLNDDEAKELLGRLIDHYVFLANGGERALVIRKLASSLATIFLKQGAPWTRAVLNLAVSLANGKYLPEEQCQSIDLENAVLPAMSEGQIVALLYFSNTLAEELNKYSSEARRGTDSHRVFENIKDAFNLGSFVLRHLLRQEASGSPVSNPEPGLEAINSYNSWMCVRGAIQARDTISAAELSPATNLVIESLKISQLSKTACQVLIDLIDWRDSVFNKDHIRSILGFLISDLGTAHISSLMEGDYEDENITFLELFLAYSTTKQRDLFGGGLDSEHEKVLELLHTLFKTPGYAAVDDLASPLALEWWTEAADDLQEIFFDADEQTNLELAKRNLARASLDCFEKLKYPASDELRAWNDDDRSEFSSFRRDVCDFLLAAYPMLGVELIQVFQERAKSSLASEDWKTFEAAVFCIAQLSEAVDDNQHADECLNAIFFCDEFSHLCEGKMDIPHRARQTLVDMLGKYQSYFERTHALLPRVLTFLFASLEVPSCAATASKSISYLCKSCRKALTLELPAFISQFNSFRFKPTATALTMERVLEGIAAIMQALPADEEKAQFLEQILHFFLEQAKQARVEATQGLIEPALARAQLVLRCVASIGKGLRSDNEIVLDSADTSNGDPYPPTFWNTGTGITTQNLVIQCMQLLVTDFLLDITLIEAACDILKAGYTEKTGPYVFPPMVTVNFVKSIPLGSAGADIVMGTASAFLASHSAHPQNVRGEAVALIFHVYEAFCWMFEKPECFDPEVANSGIDFLTRLLPKYYPILFALTSTPQEAGLAQNNDDGDHALRPPILAGILNFMLLALHGPEPLPLRSASQFFVGMFNIPGGSGQYESRLVQDAINDRLPALCRTLIQQIGGRCARSDLDHLCEVLRKIIFKHQGAARPYISETLTALGDPNPSLGLPMATAQEKERFLASLMAARGAKVPTVQLARAFWVQCRGSGFNYIA